MVRRTSVIAGKRPQAAAASRDGDGFAPLDGRRREPMARARRTRHRAERLLSARLGIGGERVRAGRTGVSALSAWSDASPASDGAARLIGLMPAISMWRAYKIPLPALVSADPYGTLGTPLLDRDMAEDAAAGLMRRRARPAPMR